MKFVIVLVTIFVITNAAENPFVITNAAENSEKNEVAVLRFLEDLLTPPPIVTNTFNWIMTIKGLIILFGGFIVLIWAIFDPGLERVVEDPCYDCPPYRPPTTTTPRTTTRRSRIRPTRPTSSTPRPGENPVPTQRPNEELLNNFGTANNPNNIPGGSYYQTRYRRFAKNGNVIRTKL